MFKWTLLGAIGLTGHLVAETKVLVLSGSTREDSFNKKLALEAAGIAKNFGASPMVIDLKDYPMPFYDGDVEVKSGMPEGAKQFRNLLIQAQGIIIANPEYNASISAVLKNALDWASRSEQGEPSRDAFKGKRFAIMSTSPGGGGGSRALEHLKAIIENAGGEVVKPQVSVPNAYQAFTAEGVLKDSQMKEKLKTEIQQLLSK